MGEVAWRRSRPVLSRAHLVQQPDSQERTSTSSSGDCIEASIGASIGDDVFGASLIVSPSTGFEFEAIRGLAVDVAAELNGTLNGTRNGAILLSSTHSEYANWEMYGVAPTETGRRSGGLAPRLLRGLSAATLFRVARR
jgi:hypothetical protein